jgi:hypothetical protein
MANLKMRLPLLPSVRFFIRKYSSVVNVEIKQELVFNSLNLKLLIYRVFIEKQRNIRTGG